MYKRISFFVVMAVLGSSICVYGNTERDIYINAEKYQETILSGNTISQETMILSSDEMDIMDENDGWIISDDAVLSDTLQTVWSNEENNEQEIVEGESISLNEVILEDDISGNIERGFLENIVSDNNMEDDIFGNIERGFLESIISDNNIEDRDTENIVETDLKVEEEDKSEFEEISRVEIPASTRVYMDPEDFSGKGQIFSESYEIKNYGNRDIAIKIKNINVFYKNGKDAYELSENKVDDEYSGTKKLNINMVWENENVKKSLNIVDDENLDEYVIYLKAAKYDKDNKFIKLNKSSKGSFYFTGSLNSNSNIQWEDEELSLNFGYEIVNAEKESNKEAIAEFVENSAVLDEEKDVNQEAVIE